MFNDGRLSSHDFIKQKAIELEWGGVDFGK
jgi:hypothetical protein